MLLLILLISMQVSNMTNLILRILLGLFSAVFFILLFFVSRSAHWPLHVTLILAIVLFLIVNIGYIVLFYYVRKEHLDKEE